MRDFWTRGNSDPDSTLSALLEGKLCMARPGEFPEGGHPGEAPFVYFDQDGESYCAVCATERKSDIECAAQHWEGGSFECADCSKVINAYYGNPEEEDDEKERINV